MSNTAVRCFVVSLIPAVLTVIALIFYLTGSLPLAAPIVWAGFTVLFWVLGLVAVIRKSRQKVVGHDSNRDG
jgi:small-conductance mechanosensitive channel